MSTEFIRNYIQDLQPQECYVLSIISRKKNNEGMTDSQQIMKRRLIFSPSDIEKAYTELKADASQYNFSFNMYISSNPRSIRKALNRYIKTLIDITEQLLTDSNAIRRISKLSGEWYSCLESPSSRSSHTKKFLIDLDNKEEFYNLIDLLTNSGITILTIRETTNGYHFITVPFDFGKILTYPKEVAACKPDALLFIESL
jgi:hypothetical protein